MDELCKQLAAFHISDRLRRLAEEQDTADQYHDDANSSMSSANSISRRPLLSNPLPGQRPCWEPRLFDYSWFEHYLAAGKEMATREGNGDVGFRTDVMDQCIETELLIIYGDWLAKQKKYSPPHEAFFWNGLHGSVLGDVSYALEHGAHEVMTRHGKSHEEWCRLRAGLMIIAREKDPTIEQYRIPVPPDFEDFASWIERRRSL